MIELYIIVSCTTFLGGLTQSSFNFGAAIIMLMVWVALSQCGVKSADNLILGTLCSNV